MEIFSNCKKILGISPNYHYFRNLEKLIAISQRFPVSFLSFFLVTIVTIDHLSMTNKVTEVTT